VGRGRPPARGAASPHEVRGGTAGLG